MVLGKQIDWFEFTVNYLFELYHLFGLRCIFLVKQQIADGRLYTIDGYPFWKQNISLSLIKEITFDISSVAFSVTLTPCDILVFHMSIKIKTLSQYLNIGGL